MRPLIVVAALLVSTALVRAQTARAPCFPDTGTASMWNQRVESGLPAAPGGLE